MGWQAQKWPPSEVEVWGPKNGRAGMEVAALRGGGPGFEGGRAGAEEATLRGGGHTIVLM